MTIAPCIDYMLAMHKTLVLIGLFILAPYVQSYGAMDLPATQNTLAAQPRKAIGVILPLSGKWKSVGHKMLKGVMLASGVFGDGETSDVDYLIRDYGNDEAQIPKIIDELDREGQVLAIIGPVGNSASDIACRHSRQKGIPSLIFSQAGLTPSENTTCFGNFLTVYTQTRTLLQTARDLRISRFAILYPTDQFGETITRSFEQLAPQFGVQVIRKTAYPPEKNDFKDVVQGLKTVPCEAVLIPDTAQKAAMIASYFPFYKISNVRLFGTNLWDTPELVREGGRNVQDAIFVSGFYAGSSSAQIRDFDSAFTAAFGSRPTIWEASAYDSAVILQNVLRNGARTRPAMRQGIASLTEFRGVTGVTSFTPNGLTRKDITVLTVRGSTVQELRQ
ncbi:MAG TPA: penicillin-binding protein activator [Deltaproteobacteria bacterium]|nr:penicillin-binding protein activator [Deltaproteobacteria bacterium]